MIKDFNCYQKLYSSHFLSCILGTVVWLRDTVFFYLGKFPYYHLIKSFHVEDLSVNTSFVWIAYFFFDDIAQFGNGS